MLFGENRMDHRQVLFDVWSKHERQLPLDPMEKKMLSIILNHPEYHTLLSNPEKNLDMDYFAESGETNPFLHMGLHLTLLEQIQTDQPRGITSLYKKAVTSFGEVHEAEHCIMNSLAIELHALLKEHKPFDEKAYFKRIKVALKKGCW